MYCIWEEIIMTDKALTPNEQVKVVQEYRKNQLASDFPELKREDFASDKEFFEALREQTIAIQNREWEIVSMSVCTGAYNEFRGMSVTDAKSAVFSNANKTGGVQSYDQCTYDEYENAENQIADDVAGITSNNSGDMIVDASGRIDGFGYGKKTTWAHCAQTASLNIYTMAEALGLLSPSPTSDAEIASALGIHIGQSGGRALCGGDYSDKDVGHQKKVADVGQLIKEGKIGPGAVISVCTDPTPNGTFSGYHALTIASVNRDENGNIVSYTVMDNNGGKARTRLQVVGIDEDHELNRWPTYEGSKPLHYTNTAAWANDQITQRYDTKYSPMFDDSGNLIGMNGKRFENEQEKIDAIRAMQRTNRLSVKAVSDEIDVLANRETILLTDTNYRSKCGDNDRAQRLKEQQERLGQYYSTQVDMIGVAGIENDILAQPL